MMQLLHVSEAASLGLHAMAMLAKAGEERKGLSALAGPLGASEHTLSKVMQRLVHAGLATSTRGPRGGFSLSGDPETITLLQVYEAVEGPIGEAGCLLGKPACDGTGCVLGGLVESVHTQVKGYLTTTTLAALAKGVTLKGERT